MEGRSVANGSGPRRTERAGYDEQISRLCSGAARDPGGATERGDGDDELRRFGRVAPDDADSGFGDAAVELEDVLDARPARCCEGDEQRERFRARGGEVAEVHRSRAEAEVAPGQPVETEVHSFHECVLCDDEVVDLRGVVIDCLGEPTRLELAQELELAELKELHRPPP